ncbi:NAD-dependent epimerase/dehydratase family protein [Aquihabitans sp. McL0605]|uniref:NAD-dependent epimerase/dehydratase family protein n=1 Tax=Aquihabitans sp. McL0605 TaxID=3415671 RepID=UPI003CF0E281
MSTIFVTGGTGLTGGNVCQQLIERGDDVRALVRNPEEAAALAALGVELIQGDIADADDVLRAAKGCEGAIHTAALLGGSSQDIADFEAVNVVGTRNVLDAAQAHGMRRAVALSTGTFFDLAYDGPREEAPLLDDPPDDPYTVTKLAAFRETHARAEAGEDVLTCHPGAIYGPGIVARRALHPTSFNAILLASMRGRIPAFLSFPVTWVAGSDVAAGSIAALDRGVAGERYWLTGRPEDEISTAAGCNRACELAGVEHRVADLDHRDDIEGYTAAFGPTLMAISEAAANRVQPERPAANLTHERLGYDPMSLDDGLGLLLTWLRDLGKI